MKSKGKESGRDTRTAPAPRGIVNPDALGGLQRRAEELGLIVHARQRSAQGRGPKKGNKK
jgi:hypothetical protein